MAYFVKQEDPENKGQFIYVEVEPDKLDIPAEVLKQKVFEHPEYRQVVDESKGRKAKIRELRADLEKLAGEPEPEGDVDTTASPDKAKVVQKTADAVAPLDEDALFAKFVARMEAEQTAKVTAKQSREQQLKAIAEKHGLGADALELLEVAQDPERAAVILEKSNYRFDDQVGGAPSATDADALNARILKNLGLDGE